MKLIQSSHVSGAKCHHQRGYCCVLVMVSYSHTHLIYIKVGYVSRRRGVHWRARTLNKMQQLASKCYGSCLKYFNSVDHHNMAHRGEQTHSLQKFEHAMRSCGVSFHIWQNKEPSGKPIPGSYDFTALSGKDKLLVLKKLPVKIDSLMFVYSSINLLYIQALYGVSYTIYATEVWKLKTVLWTGYVGTI